MIPKSPSTKSKTYLVMCLDTQLSPTKKCFVPNVDVLDFVGEIFGGIIYIYIYWNPPISDGKFHVSVYHLYAVTVY